jgi:hypothetical protein
LGCIIQVYDPQTNRWKQVLRSTFTRNKRQAQKICDAFDEAAKAAQNGTLSVDAAREIIARGVANIFATANLTALPSASIKAWCDRWVEAKAIEAGDDACSLQSHRCTLHCVPWRIESVAQLGISAER